MFAHQLAVALAICSAGPACFAQDAQSSSSTEPFARTEAVATVSGVRVIGVAPHPDRGISEQAVHEFANAALMRQAGGELPAKLSFAQIESIASEVTAAYRQAGFLVSTAIIPPQDIAPGGVLTIQMVEGRLGRVRVQGSDRYNARSLATPMQALVGQPVQLDQLEQAMRHVRSLPGISVSPVLAPGAAPGETDVILIAEDSGRPYSVRLGASNYGTESTGRYRAEAGVTIYSPLGVGDLFSASYAYGINPNDSWVGAASYNLPFDTMPGVTGVIGFTRSEIELSTGPFASLDINGPTTQGYAGLDWRIVERPQTLVQASGRYIHETARLDGLGLRLSEHTFDVLELGVAARLEHPRSRSINLAQLSVRKSFNDESSLQNFIYGAHDSHFWVGRLGLSRLQGITDHQRLSVRANAQFTDSALTPLEQFSIGGPNSVRAVPLSAALGDRGVQATFEYLVDAPGFARAPSPFDGRLWGEVLTFQLFYDWGRVSPVEQNRRAGVLPVTYEGAGFGIEFRPPAQQGLQLNLSAATVTGRTKSPDGDDVQVWASVGYTF